MTVLGMPAPIPIKVISHVHEFLRDHDFQGMRLIEIDTFKVNQDRVDVSMMYVAVGAAICGRYLACEPCRERCAIGRDPQMFGR